MPSNGNSQSIAVRNTLYCSPVLPLGGLGFSPLMFHSISLMLAITELKFYHLRMTQPLTPEQHELFRQFQMPSCDFEGILYAQRYDTERIAVHRDQVIDAIVHLGATAQLVPAEQPWDEDGIGIDFGNVPESRVEPGLSLVNELAVLNAAADVHETCATIGEPIPSTHRLIRNTVANAGSFLDENAPRITLAEAYNRATVEAPALLGQIVPHTNALSPSDRRALHEAYDTLASFERMLGGRNIIVGTRGSLTL